MIGDIENGQQRGIADTENAGQLPTLHLAAPGCVGQDDPFDPAKLRLPQSFADAIGVKKALLTVPVRKPNRQEFVWVHPDERYRLQAAVIELKEERGETYLVDPGLCSELAEMVVPKLLFTTINRQGVIFLWPVRLPGPDGRHDEWSRSALEAATIATKGWTRVVANMSLGAYDVFQAVGELPEPEFPDLDFRAILRTAFKDRFVQSADHAVIRRLQGAI